jgi:hypothetical protein
MAFSRAGCRVAAICPPGHPLRAVSGVSEIHRYRGWNSLASLRSAIRAARPDLIIPCDDGALWQLHGLHARDAEFRALIERSLGASAGYPLLESRGRTLKLAAELGIRVPANHAVHAAGELNNAGLEWPAMLKIDGTWGGDGVEMVRSPEEAARVFRTLFGPWRTGVTLKQFFVNRHPVALWLLRRRGGARVTLQKFIQGRQATAMFACWQGEVLASVSVEVVASQGPTGAATIVRLMHNEEIARAAALLAGRLNLSGFHGLDFILEERTGAPYLIEMNPRATQLGHLQVCAQGSLADALAAKLTGRPWQQSPGVRLIPGNTIALFPQAWKTDPTRPELAGEYHDVPWDEPVLVRELIRESWPDRRLLNRLLYGLWMRRRYETLFGEPEVKGKSAPQT